ncbi:UDP-2,3-diacylglucosamine diphosphatase LpxI domain-containing protein [Pseudooceanicola aestuarii]|uniref:UDP-2,3-diacylglucosamine diphosphatase LpxI domain-containing protein n=1 Tax=Pseudooceanicola aestuarii TaxID=2697319 RepID=UPI0013D5CE8F|nr:UDP-2,3-diacylglucosamine diphosphatase LpxI [Pseudooceanicola aestuarii]
MTADPEAGVGGAGAGRLGVIAGAGALPAALAAADPQALCIAFEGADVALPEDRLFRHRIERLGGVFDALRAGGVTRVVLAGAMARPALDPAALDPVMQALAPRLLAAMQGGDDTLLRLVVAVFEAEGFAVLGAHELLPELTAAAGHLAGPVVLDRALADAARGAAILDALAPVDVGQGCVVAQGLCLGIETLQGTDALLDFVARTPAHLRGEGGVFCKRPKAGQDLRVDMPAIGPDTIAGARAAGLAGICIAARGVVILNRAETLAAAQAAGISLWAQ